MFTSTWARISNIDWRCRLIKSLKRPSIWFIATLEALSVLERMKSMTASAWDKSIRPFKNARLVYSPGSAILAPCVMVSSSMRLIVKIPPWQLISIISSRVKVFGARKTEIITSSTTSSVSGSIIWP